MRLQLSEAAAASVEKLQEEKAFVDNWPPERNYLFFLAKYTPINYTAATVNIHYLESKAHSIATAH